MIACIHPSVETRLRTLSNKTTAVQKQCIICGESIGGAIRKSSIPAEEFEALPLFDDALRESYKEMEREHWKQERARQQNQWEAESPARKAEYAAYLQSPEWQAKRLKALERDEWTCRGCLNARATQVHHLTYAHRGDELLWELVSVCDECHKKAHGGNT